MSEQELIELLAGLMHKSWSGWVAWMFSRWDYTHPDDGSFQNRWKRQMNTPYSELTEKEKELDRAEAREIINILKKSNVLDIGK